MNKPISPWDEKVELASPDKRHLARFDSDTEIGMGGPPMGRLTIITVAEPDREFLVADNAAASMVWSPDSRFLAFSRWRGNRMQALCVLRLSDFTVDESPDEFRVLELHSFLDGKIAGVDSPIYQPRTFSLKYDSEGE